MHSLLQLKRQSYSKPGGELTSKRRAVLAKPSAQTFANVNKRYI